MDNTLIYLINKASIIIHQSKFISQPILYDGVSLQQRF